MQVRQYVAEIGGVRCSVWEMRFLHAQPYLYSWPETQEQPVTQVRHNALHLQWKANWILWIIEGDMMYKIVGNNTIQLWGTGFILMDSDGRYYIASPKLSAIPDIQHSHVLCTIKRNDRISEIVCADLNDGKIQVIDRRGFVINQCVIDPQLIMDKKIDPAWFTITDGELTHFMGDKLTFPHTSFECGDDDMLNHHRMKVINTDIALYR